MGESVFLTAICPLKKTPQKNIPFLRMCCSWAVFSSGPVCVREQRHGKVAFQQSCMKFNLSSQKAFNPFYAVILSNLVPKWGRLKKKKALSPTKSIKNIQRFMFTYLRTTTTTPKNCKTVFPTLWGDHTDKRDRCFGKQNPASPTCLQCCRAVVWWTGVDIRGRICQTDSDKLCRTAATHICIHSLVICPSIEFAKFPIIPPPVNMRIVLHEYHHPARSGIWGVTYFCHTPQEHYKP